jgi:hypothetical protein
MARDARKKEKHRLKRQQKQRTARKASAVTPFQKVVKSGGRLECYVNAGWRQQGMATIQVLGHAPGDRYGYAAFLVDNWCVGLKDAVGKADMTRGEFEDLLAHWDGQHKMIRVDVAEARRLVAAGLRFGRQNGFRPPPHYDRWAAILGSVGDADSASLEGFGVDGNGHGLRYMGTVDFLRRRLVESTVEQFLTRPDVQWLMGDMTPRRYDRDAGEAGEYDTDNGLAVGGDDDQDNPDESADPEDEEEFAEALAEQVEAMALRMEAAVRRWCFATGRVPHPRLVEAIGLTLMALFPVAAIEQTAEEDLEEGLGDEEGPGPVRLEAPDPMALVDDMLRDQPPDLRPEMEAALGQVKQFTREFKNPADMLRAVGIDPADEDETGE